MTEKYNAIGKYYDRLMSDYPYESVLQLLKNTLHGRGIELGTGTGKMAISLARSGLKVVGVDQSQEMLNVAMQSARKACADVVFVCEDLREYEFFPCDFVLAPCDVFNYLIEDGELEEVLERISQALNVGGRLVFDLSTREKLSAEQGTYFEDYDDVSLVWDNSLCEDVAELNLTVFEKVGKNYVRSDESHVQRAYSLKTVLDILDSLGFETQVFDENILPIKNNDENGVQRTFFLATKQK